MRSLIFIFVILFCCSVNAQSPVQPQIYVPPVPIATYSTYNEPQIYFSGGWVPYVITKPVIIEHKSFFKKTYTIVYTTEIEWIYQPVYLLKTG